MVVLGCGAYGMVLTEPRIPNMNEDYTSVISLNQVSKKLFNEITDTNYIPANAYEFDLEYTSIIELIKKYPNIFDSKYFMLPIGGGVIDKKKFFNEFKKKYESMKACPGIENTIIIKTKQQDDIKILIKNFI